MVQKATRVFVPYIDACIKPVWKTHKDQMLQLIYGRITENAKSLITLATVFIYLSPKLSQNARVFVPYIDTRIKPVWKTCKDQMLQLIYGRITENAKSLITLATVFIYLSLKLSQKAREFIPEMLHTLNQSGKHVKTKYSSLFAAALLMKTKSLIRLTRGDISLSS
jgi:hypothetical protein